MNKITEVLEDMKSAYSKILSDENEDEDDGEKD